MEVVVMDDVDNVYADDYNDSGRHQPSRPLGFHTMEVIVMDDVDNDYADEL